MNHCHLQIDISSWLWRFIMCVVVEPFVHIVFLWVLVRNKHSCLFISKSIIVVVVYSLCNHGARSTQPIINLIIFPLQKVIDSFLHLIYFRLLSVVASNKELCWGHYWIPYSSRKSSRTPFSCRRWVLCSVVYTLHRRLLWRFLRLLLWRYRSRSEQRIFNGSSPLIREVIRTSSCWPIRWLVVFRALVPCSSFIWDGVLDLLCLVLWKRRLLCSNGNSLMVS